MKKNLLKLLLIGFVLTYNIGENIILAQSTGRIMYINEFHKEGGRKTWWGGVRYSEVDKVTYISDTPTSGYTIHRTVVTCLHEGDEKCSKKLESPLVLSSDVTIAKEIIDGILETELDTIDFEIMENAVFTGNRSRTIVTYSLEGGNVYLRVQSAWSNGTADGDADIIITMFDITDDI